jgi:hypothetical protein
MTGRRKKSKSWPYNYQNYIFYLIQKIHYRKRIRHFKIYVGKKDIGIISTLSHSLGLYLSLWALLSSLGIGKSLHPPGNALFKSVVLSTLTYTDMEILFLLTSKPPGTSCPYSSANSRPLEPWLFAANAVVEI